MQFDVTTTTTTLTTMRFDVMFAVNSDFCEIYISVYKVILEMRTKRSVFKLN